MRAIACLFVLFAHHVFWTDIYNLGTYSGPLAMDLFFSLSGFLIVRILLKRRAAGAPLRVFMLNRALRLFPIYYLTVAVAVIGWSSTEGIGWWLTYTTNVQMVLKGAYDIGTFPSVPIGHTWSLAVEEHFYLMMAAMFALLSVPTIRRIVWLMLPAVFITIGIMFLANYKSMLWWTYMATPLRFGAFAFGMLCAFYEDNIVAAPRKAKWLAIAAFIAGALIAFGPPVEPFSIADTTAHAFGYPLIALGVLLFLLTQEGTNSIWERVMASNPLRAIGKISYGLYIFHEPVFWYFRVKPVGIDPNPIAMWEGYIAIPVLFLCATISYFLIERPIHRNRERISNFLFRKTAPSPS